MTIKLSMPSSEQQLKPRITVIGVGGAGGNAVNNMINSSLEGVEFLVCNTDSQALEQSIAENKLQLGVSITQGLGAGARPEIGRAAAEEVLDTILDQVIGSHMCFVTAGMGGGTGTGAAPVIAQAARENGMLTVGVVTKPFHFEGAKRMSTAEKGIEELAQYVDTLIIIPNQNLFRIANEKTTFAEAFNMADEVLNSGVRGVTDLMVMPGLINLDFADIRTVMSEMGKAMMGTGEAEGENRAISAAESAISNPLLDDITMEGAKGVLINITGGPDITLFEVDEAANRIRQEVDNNANILFGSTFEDSMEGKIRVSVVATGIDADSTAHFIPKPQVAKGSSEQNKPEIEQRGNEHIAMEPTPIELAVEASKKLEGNDGPDLQNTPENLGKIEEDERALSAPLTQPKPLSDETDFRKIVESSDSLARNPFIPPAPLDVGAATNEANELDPFSEADFTNAQRAQEAPPRKRRPSLFKRLTGAAKREEEAERSAMETKLSSNFVADATEDLMASKPSNAAASPNYSNFVETGASSNNSNTLVGPLSNREGIMTPAESNEHFVLSSTTAIRAEQETTLEPVSPPQPTSLSEPNTPRAEEQVAEPVPSEQFSLSQAETEMLEIPAFLRRQAN